MKVLLNVLCVFLLSVGLVEAECTPVVRALSPDEIATIERWQPTTRSAARDLDVPVELIDRVMYIESTGNPNAVSYAGALGLMQVMPMHWNHGENWRDPTTNIYKGTKILRYNYEQSGNWISATHMYIGGGSIAHGYVDNVWTYYCPVVISYTPEPDPVIIPYLHEPNKE